MPSTTMGKEGICICIYIYTDTHLYLYICTSIYIYTYIRVHEYSNLLDFVFIILFGTYFIQLPHVPFLWLRGAETPDLLKTQGRSTWRAAPPASAEVRIRQ